MSSPNADCLKDTVIVLINSANDKDFSVNNAVIQSLTKIANAYPNEVLQIFCDFYRTTAKVDTEQLGNIVKVLEQTCVNQIKKLNNKLAEELVSCMLKAMTESVDYNPVIQMGASSVLVAIGHEYLDLVLRSLINQLSPATVPHYTIPHTLGTLAAVNTHGVVPQIKEILGKMLPQLPLVKQDGVKQAFAYSFGHFAVAVSEQIGDNVENDNITSIKDNFVTEFSVIFDVLYNQWLLSHEPKVSESVLEALGPITRLISERQFNETVNKFVSSLLSLYRKPAISSYYISQCISYLLSPSPLNPKLTLNENVINSINHVLFNLVLLEPDYDKPQTVKNHFEVLRCFDHMAGQFPDHTLESLLHQCKNNQEKERMKAIIILTHLTTSSQAFIDTYATKFIVILKVMIAMEQGLKMKKLLVKAIVGLVYRNCMINTEDFAMVEFIIKHCGCEGPPTADKHDVIDLQDTCRSSLILMCNSVTSVRNELRNLLLQALTVDEFTASMSTVAHCLTSLLQNNSNLSNEELLTSKTENINSCPPDLIFVRCIIYIIDPKPIDRVKNLLVFLEEFSDEVNKNLKNSWAVEIQRLLKFVEKNETEEQWHNMLLDLLMSALEQVNSNKWVESVATLLSHQILTKKQSPMIKGVAMQYLATLTCHMSNAAVVENLLKIILMSLKSIPMESCGYVSKAIGIASRQHGEFVMNELDATYKENEARRGSKILNFLSTRHSKNEVQFGVVKYALITCYGKVASDCLDVHVLARLSENVTSVLYEILKSNPNFDLCRASVTTLYEIAKALYPASHHNVALRNRWQLLNAILEQIYNPNLDKRNVELYPIIVRASKALTKLQKGILPEERNTIIRVFFNSIFGELSSFKQKYEVEGNGEKNDLLAKTLNDSLILLHQLIRELIIQSTCLSTIDDLIGLLYEWLHHENDEIRTASILVTQVIFDTYIKNVKINYETPSKFGQMGFLLGLVVPGIADTNFPIRLTTIDCIKLIIQIQDLYEGHTVEPGDKCMMGLNQLQNNVLTNDLNMIWEYCVVLSNTILPKIPHLHTMQFIESLLEGFDNNEYKATGISAVLDALFIKKGQDLYQSIERIVEVMLKTMEEVNGECSLKLLKPFASLARHHSNAVTAVLLAQKIPLKPCVMSCWRYLAKDEELSSAIVENFLRLMTSIELYEDPYHITENHIAALQPLTLISALGEMLQVDSMTGICKARFADVFAVLYTTLSCYLGADPPAYAPTNGAAARYGFIPNRDAVKLSPARITLNTFNAFLDRADCHQVKEACSVWLSVEHGDSACTLSELATLVGGALSQHAPHHIPLLVARIAAYARAELPPQRSAAHALLADLLNYRCNWNPVVIETVLATLNIGWKDSVASVRACSLRGAAHVPHVPPAQRSSALRAALLALSEGVDASATDAYCSDKSQSDNVPLAAIQGLSKLLTELDTIDKEFERELVSISQKIRPFMNTECPMLREHSIRLFGVIAGRVKSDALMEQAISSLPCFLLHLCDSNPTVVRASKSTVRQVVAALGGEEASRFASQHLVDEGRLLVREFAAALLRRLGAERPGAVSACATAATHYLSVARDDLKPHAPALIDVLYSELTHLGAQSDVEPEVTRSARVRLEQLLRDANPLVRSNAAAALASVALVDCAANS